MAKVEDKTADQQAEQQEAVNECRTEGVVPTDGQVYALRFEVAAFREGAEMFLVHLQPGGHILMAEEFCGIGQRHVGLQT